MEQRNIRNFCIISHIDHGKSTLADRFLEITKTVSGKKITPQFLDSMDLEREKGITIKMKPVRMVYNLNFNSYILNLIDTPGHVDFSYEVSRALQAVEGVILLVDATKSIQAQTIANLELAKKENLQIIPVINKIDLFLSPEELEDSNLREESQIKKVSNELANLLKIDKSKILKISAKYGTNVEKLLIRVVEEIPPPKGDKEKPFRALIFDSQYDAYKGIIAFLRVIDGQIRKNEKIGLIATTTEGRVKEIGYFYPDFSPQEKLVAGEIGYLATGIKEPGKVRVGDTLVSFNEHFSFSELKNLALPGYQEPQPMIFTSFYPENSDDFNLLKEALSYLKLNDPSFVFEPETKDGLGRGFRCGFLGTLHAEIISERISREFGVKLVIFSPSVVYKITDKKNREKLIFTPKEWLLPFQIKKIEEPWITLEILTPQNYLGKISELLTNIKGKYIKTKYFSQERILLIYQAPLREIIVNFYDKLKSISQGYASMNYHTLKYREANLVKIDILVGGKIEPSFSKITPQELAFQEGKNLVNKLKEILPAQQFPLALQAKVNGKIIARETIKAKRRDVTAPLYGGDVTRKKKLLERQKRGKKILQEKGRVRIPQKVYFEVFKKIF